MPPRVTSTGGVNHNLKEQRQVMAKDILTVIEQDGDLVVDSRLIAERLGIQHESFLKTIRKHRERVEARFGHLRFEIGTVTNSVGAVNEVTFALLTEPQASVLMTLSKNTDQVVECKLELVDAFTRAKDFIKAVVSGQSSLSRSLPPVRDTIEYLEAADRIQSFPDPLMRSLLNQRLMEELSAGLPLLNASTQTQVILTVRAKELGYADKQIGSGAQLGKFVSRLIPPNGKTQHGKYPVNCYDLTSELDETIHAYFR